MGAIDWRLRTAVLSLAVGGSLVVVHSVVSSAENLVSLLAHWVVLVVCGMILLLGFKVHSPYSLVVLMLAYSYGVEPILAGKVGAGDGSAMAFLYIATFVVFLAAGHRVGGSTDRWNSLARQPDQVTLAGSWSVYLLFVVCAIVGWGLFLGYLGIGPMEFYQKSHEIRLEIAQTPGLYFVRQFLIWLVWLPFWLGLARLLVSGSTIGVGRAIAFGVWFVGIELWMISLGQRFYVFWPILNLLVLFSLTRKEIGIWKFSLVAPILVILSGIYIFYRNLSFFESATLAAVATAVWESDLITLVGMGGSGDLSKIETLRMVIAEFPPSGEQWLLGQTLAALPTLVVPQSLVGWKLPYTDVYLTATIAGDRAGSSGLAFGAVAELYINFHVIGVVVGAFVLGRLLRAMADYVETNRRDPCVLLWYVNGGTLISFVVVGGLYSVTTIEWLGFAILNVGLILVLSLMRKVGQLHGAHSQSGNTMVGRGLAGPDSVRSSW